jgi:hypothetical protein
MPDRARERASLELIYDPADFDRIDQDGVPDFRLTPRGADWQFGVEVTDLFYTEAEARLARIPGYTGALLAGEPHLHRDDIELLRVEEVELLNGEGGEVVGRFKAVARQAPSLSAYRGALVERIAAKEAKLPSYDGRVAHTSLLIHDRGARLAGFSVEEAYPRLFTPEVRNAVLRSGFAEVYFVTRVAREHELYFPLRLLLLAAEARHLGGALEDSAVEEAVSPDGEVQMLGRYLRWRGGAPRMAHAPGPSGNAVVVLGSAGISLNDHGTQLIAYRGHLPASRAIDASSDPTSEEEIAIFKRAAAIADESAFRSNMGLRTRTRAPKPDDAE